MIAELERFIQLDMRAMRISSLTLRQNFGLHEPWPYTLWLGGQIVRHFDSLDDVAAYLDAAAAEADYRDWTHTVEDARYWRA